MRGQLPAGFTPQGDSQNNLVVNDYGTYSFQESIWVYELGNSLGDQTGKRPQAQDEQRRYQNETANDVGGPALVDCVYGGRVSDTGKISPPSNPR